MGSKVLKINCLCNFLNFDSLHNFLLSFHDYKLANLENDNVVDFRIDGKNVRIKLTHDKKQDIHVCLSDCIIDRSNEFSEVAKQDADYCKKYFPTVPIILVCKFNSKLILILLEI